MGSANTPPSRTDRARALSLRSKWTLSILIVALLPMLVLGLTMLRLQRDGLARVEKELEVAVVDEAAKSLVSVLDDAADIAGRTAALLADEREDVDSRLERIRAETGRASIVRSVAFFDTTGAFVDAVVTQGGVDDLLREPPRAEGYQRLRGADGLPVLRFVKKSSDGPGGFVVVTVAPRVIGDRLRDLSLARFGAEDRLYIVDDHGEIVSGARGRAGRPPILAALPPTLTTELVLTTEFDDQGIAKVGTIRTVPALRLAVIVERPLDEAFATLARTRKALLVGIAVFATLAAILGTWLARHALRPVSSLVRLIERYARRDFAARNDVHSRDELEDLGGSLERMADDLATSEAEIARRARVEANLSRYLPAEVAASAKAAEHLMPGGARRPITVLFADVAAFTGFVERTSPERSVALLNELFTILSEIVFRHDGMIDKFIGDCIMAVFRGEDGDASHTARALRAADDMHRFVESSHARWKTEFDFDVRLGIGVASGEALVGNLGSEARMEYTAIGDAVNVAARLESLARPKQTLTTPGVVAACSEFDFASLGEHTIRGRSAPIEVFEVVS